MKPGETRRFAIDVGLHATTEAVGAVDDQIKRIQNGAPRTSIAHLNAEAGGTATMSAPAVNAFVGKTTPPSDSDLERALARAKPVWDRLIADLASEHDVASQEWKSYSAKSGWSLRLKRGKRTIVWLAPCNGFFQVVFIFGDRAVVAARQSGLSAQVLRALDDAPRYPEGTGLRLQIKAAKDIPLVRTLAAIKLQN